MSCFAPALALTRCDTRSRFADDGRLRSSEGHQRIRKHSKRLIYGFGVTLVLVIGISVVATWAATQDRLSKYASGGALVDSALLESPEAVSSDKPLDVRTGNDASLRLNQLGGGWNYIDFKNDTGRTA
jgi:hypothetical protein